MQTTSVLPPSKQQSRQIIPQLFPQDAEGFTHLVFYRLDGDIEGIGNFLVGFFFKTAELKDGPAAGR